MTARTSHPIRTRAVMWLLAFVLLTVAALAGRAAFHAAQPVAQSIPVPVPVYAIEAKSGNHTASLLNLPIGQPGVPQVPMPVDVDGDLLPDVTVALNLLDVEGGLPLPIDLTALIAPNIQIDRLVTAPILGQKNPPLEIKVKLTLLDATLQKGPTVIKFGYSTGLGGSIPTSFKAVLGGLDQFFNPLRAVVDTGSGYLGIDPSLEDLGLAPVAGAYRGPLHLLGGIESDALNATLDLGFDPMPERIQVDYGHDTMQHIDVAHATQAEVDLTPVIDLSKDGVKTHVDGVVQRLPREFGLDINTAPEDAGEVHYTSSSDGRLPDAAVNVTRDPDDPNLRPMHVNANVTSLPPSLDVVWSTPKEGPLHVDFDAGGPGIGAVEATIKNYDGVSPAITPHLPSERQYLSVQTDEAGFGGDLLMQARLERVKSALVDHVDKGPLDLDLMVGDGATPLDAFVDADLRTTGEGGPHMIIHALVAPLPEHITLHFAPAAEGDATQPLNVKYDSSRSADLDADIKSFTPDAPESATCGDVGTMCADIGVRNLPTHLEATVLRVDDQSTELKLDADPAPGGLAPDVKADLAIGPKVDDESPRPLFVTGEVLGVPARTRVRMLTDTDDSLQRVDAFACDVVYATGVCNSAIGEIGELSVVARNFVDRPADMPPPAEVAPTWVSATMRGQESEDDIVFEVGAALKHLHGVRFLTLPLEGLVGADVKFLKGNDLAVHVDAKNLVGKDDNRFDIGADAVVSPLPENISFCMGQQGRPVSPPFHDTLTELCESTDPFGDQQGSPALSPLEIHYQTNKSFDLDGSFTRKLYGPTEDADDDETLGATFSLDHVPSSLTAAVAMPENKDDPTPTRVRAHAPGATLLDGTVGLERGTGGATCADARPSDGDILCADVDVTKLPPWVSVFADTKSPDMHVAFHACDFDFLGTNTCRPGTGGPTIEIGQLTARVRIDDGDAPPVPVLPVPNFNHAVLALEKGDDDGEIALEADVRVDGVRKLVVRNSDTRLLASTDIGNGLKPFAAVVDADLRQPSNGEDEVRFVVDSVVTPLPKTLDVFYLKPGEDQAEDPTRILLDSSDLATVTAKRLDIFEETSADDDCGKKGSLCAEATIKRLPQHTDVVIRQLPEDIGDGAVRTTSTYSIEAVPHANQAKPDIDLEATIGPESFGMETPHPLVIDATLTGLPYYTNVRLVEKEDEDVEIESADVHTCIFLVEAEACFPFTEGVLDDMQVSARNFLFRPKHFPPPAKPANPDNDQYASVTKRDPSANADNDDLFEVAGHLTDIREVRFVTLVDGNTETGQVGNLMGARLRAGASEPMLVTIDLEGLRPGAVGDFEDAVIDAFVEATIEDLPESITFCMRSKGIADGAGSGTNLTTVCENPNPFALDPAPEESPLSIVYDAAGATIDHLHTNADVTIREADDVDEESALHIKGDIDVLHLPSKIVAHLQIPEKDEEGATLAQIDAPATAATVVTAAAELTHGDAICADPRTQEIATCISFTLNDLPDSTFFRFDPDAEGDNIEVRASEDTDLSITDLKYSSVAQPVYQKGRPVTIIEGIDPDDPDDGARIIGLPDSLVGRIAEANGGEAPDVRLTATEGNPIDEVTLRFQNYVTPDPLPLTAPAQRTNVDLNPDQYVHVFQRGHSVRAAVHITSLQSVGLRQQRDANGDALDTLVASAGFGTDQNLRAYVDLSPGAGTGGLSDHRLIADVTLENVPTSLQMCIRGSHKTTGLPVDDPETPENEQTWCDSLGEGGGVEMRSQHADDDLTINVDAFVRMTSQIADDPDAKHLAAELDIDGIPALLRARFPTEKAGLAGGTVEVQPLTADADPSFIERVEARVASFDLTGVYAAPPYSPRIRNDQPFPVSGSTNQHLNAVLVDGDFALDARIGTSESGNDPDDNASRVSYLKLDPHPCPAPANHPADYPYFPENDAKSSYQCVIVTFSDTKEAVNDPLDIELVRQQGTKRVALRNAGIDDIPDYIQMTLSDAVKYEDLPGADDFDPANEQALRRPCQSYAMETPLLGGLDDDDPENDEKANCMPPLVRFDQPSNAILFGSLTVLDNFDDAIELATAEPFDPEFLPPHVAPGATGDAWLPQWPSAEGVRLKMVKLNPNLADDDGDGIPNKDDPDVDGDEILNQNDTDFDGGLPERLGLSAHFRLSLPQSLTIDQIQKWKYDNEGENFGPKNSSADMRMHLVARKADGTIVDSLGRMSAMLGLGDGTDVLLAGAFDDPKDGFGMPGELGAAFYKRTQTKDLENSFIQFDGRMNKSVNIGVKYLKDVPNEKTLSMYASLKGAPATDPDVEAEDPDPLTLDPSFRVLMETVKDGPNNVYDDNAKDPCKFTKCTQTDMDIDMNFDVDLSPDDVDEPARRVELFVRLGMPNDPVGKDGPTYKKTKNGIELWSYNRIAPPEGEEFADPAPIDGKINLTLSNLMVYKHWGVPVLLSYTFDMLGEVKLTVDMDRVEHLQLTQNLLHVGLITEGDDAGSTEINNINIHLDHLSFRAWALLPLALVYWVDGDDQVNHDIVECLGLGGIGPKITAENDGGANDVIWPINKTQYFLFGLGVLEDVLSELMCAWKVFDKIPTEHPKAPFEVTGHEVPGTDAEDPGNPPASDPDDSETPEPEDETISVNTQMCGPHTYKKLTVDAVLTARGDCTDDEGGRLQIVAEELEITSNGKIVGRAEEPGRVPAGNSGGSHGGQGGDGTLEDSPNVAFGSQNGYSKTEEGERGAGGTYGGDGGGTLSLSVGTLLNNGTIDLAGDDGSNNNAPCDDDAAFVGGGGAGGGLILVALSVDNNGLMTVAGGAGGGHGAGGGGAGGIAKVKVPVWDGPDVVVSGGSIQQPVSCDVPDLGDDDGRVGGAGDLLDNSSTISHPIPLDGLWQSDTSGGLALGYESAADLTGFDAGYQVVLCTRQVSGETVAANLNTPLEQLLGDEMPVDGDVAVDDPCGGQPAYASASSLDEVVKWDGEDPPLLAPTGETLDNGFAGFWTTVLRKPNGEPGRNCLDDSSGCTLIQTDVPDEPIVVHGIDNDDPVVTITEPDAGDAFLGDTITPKFSIDEPDYPLGSGIATTRCRIDGGPWSPCVSGTPIQLPPGAGDKVLQVQAIDGAGNGDDDNDGDTVSFSVQFLTPPDVSVEVSDPGPDGYHSSPPTITLHFNGDDAAPGNPPFFFAIDEDAEQQCDILLPQNTCVVPGGLLTNLISGEHRVGLTGHDVYGQRFARSHYMDPVNDLSTEFFTDYTPPIATMHLVPPGPTGDDGWHTTAPLLVASSIDDEFGSGIDRMEYTLNGVTWFDHDQDNPVVIGAGVYDIDDICVRAFDVAGHSDKDCNKAQLEVDLTAPDGDVTIDGNSQPDPDGTDPWFITVPDVAFTSTDGGSGLPTDDGDVRYRVDNGEYQECEAPCSVPAALLSTTGHHEVHWSVVDEAGNRTEEETVELELDLDAPTTLYALAPFGPEGANDWHLRKPEVRLWASDETDGRAAVSGVPLMTGTRYQVDNDLIKFYNAPIELDAGLHQVCFFSEDVAGNVEQATCIEVKVDLVDPLAQIVVPPVNVDPWHTSNTTANGQASDTPNGSGFANQGDLAKLCDHLVDDNPAPAGVCISIDHRPFEPLNPNGGAYAIGEGVHDVRVIAVEVSGRRSEMQYRTVRVDKSLPVSSLRLFPDRPAANNWFRSPPVVNLIANDGDQNAGVTKVEYRLNNNPQWTEYKGPFVLPEGTTTVGHRSKDAAGRTGNELVQVVGTDLTPPTVKATSPNPALWLKIGNIMGPANAQLKWTVNENLASSVSVLLIIHDLTGNVVRLLDAGVHQVTPGQTYQGSTNWDGKDQTLLGLVPVGIYYYRAVAVDPAGNWAHSGESAPIQIKLKVCLPLLPC